MIIWLAMLIPFIGCAVAFFQWKKQFVWWELLIPTVISFLVILGIKSLTEHELTHDTQYKSGIIVEARYYEYWSTWIHETCSYECDCTTDKKGNRHCSTCYRDCSHCDENRAYWEVYDDQGNHWEISESDYNRLKAQWKATPEFVELNRSINTHGDCGQDGNMYRIRWDGQLLDVESSTWESSYENKVQASKSNFDLRDVSEEDAIKYQLYDYPKVNLYKQSSILGLDSLNYINENQKAGAVKLFEYFNGTNGPKRKIKVFVLLFSGKSLDEGVKQRNYWDGGNKNEMVICIDVDRKSGEINWVYPFSWTENKRVAIDLRDDISNMKLLDFTKLYHIVDESTTTFSYRDFSQFGYLEIDPPTWEIWLVYLLTLGITIGILYYGYINEFENDN